MILKKDMRMKYQLPNKEVDTSNSGIKPAKEQIVPLPVHSFNVLPEFAGSQA